MLEHSNSIDTSVKPTDEHNSLKKIIQSINERFLEDFTKGNRVLVETMLRILRKICRCETIKYIKK